MIGPGTVTRGSSRVRAFDGMRGLAVIAVVLFHAQFDHVRGGFLGVSAFFTLSGFLITSLLLDEHAREDRISLRSFWSRRARRLLPAAYVALAGVLVYGATVATGDQVRAMRGDVLSCLAYVANWRFYFAGRSYAQLFSAPSPVLHFWSLAIEEQFYLVFPLVMVGVLTIARGRRTIIAGVLATGTLGSVAASNVLMHTTGESRVYYGTDTRAAELLIGALLAVALHNRDIAAVLHRNAQRAITALGVAALLVMFGLWATVSQSATWLYHGGFAGHALLTAIVIIAARLESPFSRALGWRPLEYTGRLSYAIYLFHWPIYLWLSPERVGWSTWPLLALRLSITFVLAIASYRWLEQPVLRGNLLRGNWPRLVAPVAAVMLVIAVVGVTWSPPKSQIVLTSLGSTPGDNAKLVPPPPPKRSIPTLYRRATPARPLRILVVGDSVGVTLGRGLELWGHATNDAQVDNIARIYCPLGRKLVANEGFGIAQSVTPCDWTKPWNDAIASFNPDVTIVNFTIWEGIGRKLPGSDEWRSPGDPALDAWMLSEYKAAAETLTARGGDVVWLNAPCDKDVAIAPKTPLWYVNNLILPAVAKTQKLVHLVDANAQLCKNGKPLSTFAGAGNVRPDGAHFSDPGAFSFASWLMQRVLGQETLAPYRAAS